MSLFILATPLVSAAPEEILEECLEYNFEYSDPAPTGLLLWLPGSEGFGSVAPFTHVYSWSGDNGGSVSHYLFFAEYDSDGDTYRGTLVIINCPLDPEELLEGNNNSNNPEPPGEAEGNSTTDGP